jgi:hypothetical protein
MCAEASTILRAVAADFCFNCWYLEIRSDNRIRHIPKVRPLSCARLSIGNVLEFYVGSGSRTPELYSIGPDWSEYSFIYEKLVACG